MVLAACASRPVVQEDRPEWTVQFARPVEFQILVGDNLLLVGTQRHLFGVDLVQGRTLWRKRNVAVSGKDLTPLPDSGHVLVNDAAGGSFDDRDTNILALDPRSGDVVWESPVVEGKILHGVLDPDRKVYFFVTVPRAHGDDRGFLAGALGKGLGAGYEQVPVLSALEIETGAVLWSQPFETKVRMRPSYGRVLDDRSEWATARPFDLGLYHPPLIVGDRVCVTYAGVHCYDRRSGALAWRRRFDVIENDLALSYANPMVDRTALITTGANRVRAFDRDTGKPLWRSERFDMIAELQADGDTVYAQLGGQFLDLDAEKWKWKGDFGVAALDRRTGKTRWKYEDADDTISNLLVYGDRVWFADEDSLIAMDRETGELRLRQPHGFDQPPEFTALNEAGQIVVVAEGWAAAFDAAAGAPVWAVHHPPIGPGAWARFGDSVRRSTGNTLKFLSFVIARAGGILPSLSLPLGSVDFTLISTKRVVSGSLARSGRRMAYRSGAFDTGEGNANFSGNFQYFVTQPRGYDHPALAVVNLATGSTERLVRLQAERPNLVINEATGNLYQAFDRQLVALRMEGGASLTADARAR